MDRASRWGGHVHRGLVRLQRDQRVVDRDGFADADQHLNDRYRLKVADVRDTDFDPVVNPACGAVTSLLAGIRMRTFMHVFFGRQAGRSLSLHDHENRSLRDGVSDADAQVRHGPGDRRGYVHGGFVRLQRDQWVVDGNGVTGIDVDLDHRHVAEVADVGDLNLDSTHDAFLASLRGEAGGRLRAGNTTAG